VLVVKFDGDVSHCGFEDDVGRHAGQMCVNAMREKRDLVRDGMLRGL